MTFRIFGHGTLSGDFLPHPNYANPPSPPEEHYKYHPINIYPASNVFVEGLTIANSPSHSLSLVGIFSNTLWKVKRVLDIFLAMLVALHSTPLIHWVTRSLDRVLN